MKNLLATCLLAMCATVTFSQNVGIGTAAPSEKLDVNGNINVSGSILANGTDGTANQVLMKNAAGDLAWGSLNEFKNRATLLTSQNWTVPANVTRIAIEVWGAGGGGSYLGGGGGGGYVCGFFTVAPGNIVTTGVGTGGGPGSTITTGGTSSYAAIGGIVIEAFGGTSSNPGIGGRSLVTAGFTNYFAVDGERGQHSKVEYFARSSSNFIEVASEGNGGDAGASINTAGDGAYRILEVGGTIIRNMNGTPGKQPGGGGGAGYNMLSGALVLNGYLGGNGMICIRY